MCPRRCWRSSDAMRSYNMNSMFCALKTSQRSPKKARIPQFAVCFLCVTESQIKLKTSSTVTALRTYLFNAFCMFLLSSEHILNKSVLIP